MHALLKSHESHSSHDANLHHLHIDTKLSSTVQGRLWPLFYVGKPINHGFRAPEKEAVNLEAQHNPLTDSCKLVVHNQLYRAHSAKLKSPLSFIDSNTVLSSTSAKSLKRVSSKD